MLDSADIVRDTLFPRRLPCCGFCGDANHRMDGRDKSAAADRNRLAREREDQAGYVLIAGIPQKDRA